MSIAFRLQLRALSRQVVLWSVACCFAFVPFAQAQQPPSRDQRIEEMQKQIEALKKRLDEIKAPSGPNSATPATPAAMEGGLPESWVKSLTWRSIGPAGMGGRITAISVYGPDPSTYFVATASGGLLKTTNNGVTFEHQFDHEATVSLGDVCVSPSNANIVWVGTGEANPRNSASYGDGVYKSTDGGKTWKNMGLKKSFQIGKVLIHPTNPDIVYVGALGRLWGPNEERGLFKTIDGGKTWNKILYFDDKTGVVDIRMHPKDPESLLVAMYDRERDEFDSHPGQPALPDGYDSYDPSRKWGPHAGIYKTTDGGKTFKKCAKGLPTVDMGRIGLDCYLKVPGVVYAIVESKMIGAQPAKPEAKAGQETYLGVRGEDADAGAKITAVTADGPAAKAGLLAGDIVLAWGDKSVYSFEQLGKQIEAAKPGAKVDLKIVRKREGKTITVTVGSRAIEPEASPGSSNTRPFNYMYNGQREGVQAQQGNDGFQTGGIYRSADFGDSWTRINSLNPRPMYFSVIRVDPIDEKYLYVLGINLHRSVDGGKKFTDDGANGVHPDQHALWIDPKDGRHMLIGCDGGFYATYDRMQTWDFLNHMAIGQFYHVAVDSRKPYHVYGGLQDNCSWGGPSRGQSQGGFGGVGEGTGPLNEDWIMLGGGDGFVCRVDPNDPDIVFWESQDGNVVRKNLRTGANNGVRPRALDQVNVIDWKKPFFVPFGQIPMTIVAPTITKRTPPFRFNWNTPFILSSHNSKIFYSAGNYVFRSVKQGDDLRAISPEITRTHNGMATALAESPRNPEVLYVGTDDGWLWVTRDGGKTWTNITANVGLPGPRTVASIEPSRYVEGRCYVAFDGHRSNDDEPYLYATDDFGATWKSIRANLPTGSARVLREDIENSSLLFAGTEFAAWASTNRGASWTKINNNLPTVAVHEFAIHPTAGEMVAATHGRSLWILDVTPLRGMTSDALKAPAHLYAPNTVVRWRLDPTRLSPYGVGARRFIGKNPPYGAMIYYSLTKKAEKVDLKIVDWAGKTVQPLAVSTEPGLHVSNWALIRSTNRAPAFGAGGGQRGFGPGGAPVPPGTYRVVLTVDGQEYTQPLKVELDPALTAAGVAGEIDSDSP
ncbi:MAG TPA: PDZ domain-containing protein [Gemmataceae bacterium]|nr:PDZ domain-containing protein [Gemmataceae bacterium]